MMKFSLIRITLIFILLVLLIPNLAMKTGKRLLAMMLIILLTGCSANMIRVPGDTSQYAPMNDNPNRGVISYKANGPAFAVKARLEDAYKQMYEACSGKYIIINEDSQIAGAVAIPAGRATVMPVMREGFITFECVKDKQ